MRDPSAIRSNVQKLIRRAIDNCNVPIQMKHLQQSIVVGLTTLVSMGDISSFSGLEVSYTKHQLLRHVDDLPPEAKPGDAVVGQVSFLDGSSKPEYRGIVLSVHGNGEGFIFAKPEFTGEVRVRCNVRATGPLDYVAIEVVHATD